LTVCGPGGTKVPFLYGIRVNCICPGPVATPLRAKNYPNEDPSTITSPEEVARIILFLSCDESAAINGADIDVAWKGQDILPTIRTPKSQPGASPCALCSSRWEITHDHTPCL
jgi:hypothetical protein